MSGIEVVGLIASIIAITDAIVKVYAATKTASGLPEAFYDVATRLPLVRNTISEYLNNTNPDEQSCEATKAVLRSCEDRAKKLEKIFKDVISQANPSTTERFLLAVHTLGKGGRVESLMKGIQEDVQLLTGYHVTKLATQASIAAVREHISALLLHGIHPPATAETERDFLLKELKWTDPTIDKGRIERTKGGLYEDSSCWILSHPNYKDWKDGKTKLLWVKGGAGKGKTMLLIAITKQLRSQTRLDHPVANSSLSFFFCQNTDDRLNNAVAILKGLIYLLLVQDVSLVSYLKSDCDRMGKDIFDVTSNNVNAFDALSNVFRQMIQHSRSETMYLAVDALDECKDGLPDLLKLVRETALQENRLKWILTSRNRVDIEENLALDSPGARLSLEVNSEAVSQAIETYIIHKVAQVSSLRSSPIQRTNIQQKLLEKAEGTFLWVDLVLRSIYTLLADEAVRCIDKTPPGLLPLYDQMMGDVGKFASDYRDSCLTVLSVATLAYRPLHILELRTLAGLEYETADLERIVDMCGSFLTLVDSHVYPIHQSAKDYLASDVAAKKIFQSGKCAVQRNIVDRSIVAMEKTLRRDVYQLVHPGALSREVEARPPTLDPLLGVGYSCTYWIDHVCETDKADLQGSRRYRIANTLRRYVTGSKKSIRIRDLIEAFFHDHFLHWLEALSLLGVISNGVLSLARLRTIIEARMDAFMDLVEDIYRFILLNQWLVEQAPLQTYISALLFTPTDSIIRRIFAKEEPGWVLTKPVVEQVWNLCLQTFEGHSDSVRSVAFSPDGSRVASGSDDRTIRIWDARSGKEVQKLEGHSNWVWSVAFSPDGSRVASGSDDTTIRIWDARSGKEVQKLEGRTPNFLRFEDLGDSGLWLRTGAGSIKLEDGSHDGRSIVADTSRMINSNGQSTSNPQTPFSGTGPRWDLGGDGSWVTWRGQGSIWLPPDFRPGVSDISGDGSAIAIGRRTGRVVVLRMSMEASFP